MRYKIGDLAKLFNLSTESIRHYERQALSTAMSHA